MDLDKELDEILNNDPFGVLVEKPKATTITSDQKLIDSFEEINAFVDKNGQEPQRSRDIQERSLYGRLKGIRDNPLKAEALIELDKHNLLTEVQTPKVIEEKLQSINSVENVLDDDPLGILSSDDFEDEAQELFNLKNVPKSKDMPDYIGERKPCEDFHLFEPIFKQVHEDLKTSKMETYFFNSDKQIAEKHFYLVNGLLIYVAEVGEKEKKLGKWDARLRLIYENGTESDILLRSLARALYKDESGRRIVSMEEALFDEEGKPVAEDQTTGFVYVLKSLSNDPQITSITNLYKIGFSSQPTLQRIKNAANEPTYLMADVELIAEFETLNLNPQKLESLLHTFFAGSCLDLVVHDEKGIPHKPREWFIVPFPLIKTAIQMLLSGDIMNYRFDPQLQEIVER